MSQCRGYVVTADQSNIPVCLPGRHNTSYSPNRTSQVYWKTHSPPNHKTRGRYSDVDQCTAFIIERKKEPSDKIALAPGFILLSIAGLSQQRSFSLRGTSLSTLQYSCQLNTTQADKQYRKLTGEE